MGDAFTGIQLDLLSAASVGRKFRKGISVSAAQVVNRPRLEPMHDCKVYGGFSVQQEVTCWWYG